MDGIFQVAYNYTKSGTYWMTVTVNTSEVGPAPPGNLVVTPNVVYPPLCLAVGDATSEAIVKQTNTFTVIVKDVFNNTRMWAPDPPVISLSASGLPMVYGSAANQTNGTYLISYFIDQKVTYSMIVTLNGQHILNSPFQVNTNYGNNSPPTVIIVCSVLGGVVLVGAIVGFFIWRKHRSPPYERILG